MVNFSRLIWDDASGVAHPGPGSVGLVAAGPGRLCITELPYLGEHDMTVLSVRTRGPSRPRRASRPGAGPNVPVETADETFDRSRADRDHAANTTRARRLLGAELRYIAHPSFDDPDARDEILAPMPEPAGAQAPRRTQAPDGLPPYLASLYHTGPLLSRTQEAHLFRKMNYLLYWADRLRGWIDPDRARSADLDA